VIRLEPWRHGVSGSGYVLRDHAGVYVAIHRAGPDLNPILQLIEIERSNDLAPELLHEQIVAAIQVDPEGAFKLRSRLRPWKVVELADEVMVADPRLWHRGSNWRWQ
jgi:hypothetical protein